VACLRLLYERIGVIETGDEIVFADELGSWMIPVDERKVIGAYLKSLAATASPERYTGSCISSRLVIPRQLDGPSLPRHPYSFFFHGEDAVSTVHLEHWLTLGLALLFLALLVELSHFPRWHPTPPPTKHRSPRPLRPRTPDDCPFCQAARVAPVGPKNVIPYAQRKSAAGRKKMLDTQGYSCPYPDCDYFQITDATVHALIGYGHHGRHEPIQDFYCMACHRKFTSRRHTALYRLKASSKCVAQALHAIAEGLSLHAAARVFSNSETTLRSWLSRAGQHSKHLHERFLCAIHLTHVQLDELRLKLHGAADLTWLWIACDAGTKLIPAFALGSRTQAFAHQLVHDVAQRLAADRLPVFCSDGLALYFYSLTAHFGAWVQAANERRRTWCVDTRLLYAQVVKRYRRHRITEIHRHVLLGRPEAFRQALITRGFSSRVQTAFIERLNLTVRRSLASLARRSWSTAHSTQDLALQFDW
jgi:IS1 family transposase